MFPCRLVSWRALSLVLVSACTGEVLEGAPLVPVDGPGGTRTRSVVKAVDMRVGPPPPFADPATVLRPLPFTQPSFPSPRSAPSHVPALSGGTLLVLRDGRTAVASAPDRDRIYVADMTEGRLITEIPLTAGDEPGRLVEDASGRVHAVLRGAGAIVTLAPASFAVSARRPVCPAPRGLGHDASSDRLYVACAGGELVALPSGPGAPLWTRTLDRDLRDVVVTAEGLYVTTFRRAEALVVSADGEIVERLEPRLALNLTRRDRSGPGGPASTRFRPAVAWRTVPFPDGGVLMLHQRAFTGEVAIDPQNSAYGATDCGSILQTAVTRLGRGRREKPAPAMAGMTLPLDVAVSATGDRVAVLAAGGANAQALGSSIVVARPEALATTNDTGCVATEFLSFGAPVPTGGPMPWREFQPESTLVRNRVSGEAVALAFAGSGELVVQFRDPPELQVPGRRVRIALAADRLSDTGMALFHSDSGGGVACASCHPEGGDDGLTWTFRGAGPRRTQSLRGGVKLTVPLHWEGDMRDLSQITREVFTGRMGGPELTAETTDALASWIEGLPLLRMAHLDAAAVARGRALFEDARTACASCHAGPLLTNNQTVDVGTGGAFQVPSLRGLGARAPFMHDGCAATLDGRFDLRCGGDGHGDTSHLGEEQRRDLSAFLQSL